MEKQINYDNHQDESKTRTHSHKKLPGDRDPWAPNKLLKSGAKEKHQLGYTGGLSSRLEAPAPTNLNE